MALENIIKKTGKFIAKNAIIPLSFLCLTQSASALFEKNPIIMPLGSAITYRIQTSQGYKFPGDSIEATMTPDSRPFQNVRGQYQFVPVGSSLTNAWTDAPVIQSNDSYKMQLDPTQPGNYYFQFKVNSGTRETQTTPVKVPVYMNESQSDQALSEAITEIGVIPVGSALEDTITDKWTNQSSLGYTSDAVVAVKNTTKRAASNPRALYYIDVQGSELDAINFTKKNALNANGEGYIHIGPVQSKDEIKQQINSEKNLSWPQVASISTGYAVSAKAGDIFNGENTDFTITSTGANGAEVSVKTPSGSYGAYESLSKSGSNFTKNITTSEYGDHKAKFRLSLDRTVMNEVIDVADEATSSVYMNKSDLYAIIEQAIKEVAIADVAKEQDYYETGKDPTLVAENEIMSYWVNANSLGYNNDTILGIKKGSIRGPPSYQGYQVIDFKCSNSENYDPVKYDVIHNQQHNGYSLENPVKSKDEIKQVLLQKKSDGWDIIP